MDRFFDDFVQVFPFFLSNLSTSTPDVKRDSPAAAMATQRTPFVAREYQRQLLAKAKESNVIA